MLGALQGIAEPFPISSLGHGVVLPRLLGWNIHQNDDYFLAFLVATHVATALVLLFIFLDDWKRIVRGLGRSLRDREIRPDDTGARLGWLLVVGTIPAGTLGLLLEHPLRSLFASPASAAAFLIVNGVLLLVFERLRRRPPRPGDYLGDSDARIAKLSWRQAIGGRDRAGGGARPRDLALRDHDGRRAFVRALERGRSPVCVPARDADHRRGRRAEDPGSLGLGRKRRSRPGPGRGRLRRRRPPTWRSSSCSASSRPTR